MGRALSSENRAKPQRRPQTDVVLFGSAPFPLRVFLTVFTAVCTLLAYMGLAGNQFTRWGTIAWLGAIVAFLLAFAEAPAGWREGIRTWTEGWNRRPLWHIQVNWTHLALISVILLAAFFRFYRLATLPLDMWSDQAEKLLDVHDVLNGARPIFFPRNTGREAFQFYLTAALIRFTPLSLNFMALKVGTALTSLITIPLAYLLARELYGRHVALLASAFLAVSHWHVTISRVGLRFPLTAAFATPTLYFLLRAFKHNRRNDWLACGLVLGVGLHTYIPMRIVPVLLVLLVGIKLTLDLLHGLRGPQFLASKPTAGSWAERSALTAAFWQNALLGGVASLLVFLPLLRYMRDEPHMFWYRVASRAPGEVEGGVAETWHTFWGNVKNALLMFNYRGDVVVTNNIPGMPVLDQITGALFVLGVAYLLWRLIKYGDRRPLYVLVALFVLLLPSILSLSFPNENPSVVRTGGAIPLVMLIAALPLWVIGQQLRFVSGQSGGIIAGFLMVVILMTAAGYNYDWYFVRYDAHYRRTVWNTNEMAQVARGFADSIGDLAHVYHVPYPYWADTRLIGINAGDITWSNAVSDTTTMRQQASDPAAKLYLLYVHDNDALSALMTLYPQGGLQHYKSAIDASKDFLIFFVPEGG
jgi:hypothetical protein